MFERFTEDARDVVVAAQDAARRRGHDHLRTSHLLAGLLDGETFAAQVLDAAGVTTSVVAAALDREPGLAPGADVPLRFDDEATSAIERATRRVIRVGHNYVTPEHLLEAMLDAPTAARDVVERAGIDPQRVLTAVEKVSSPRRA